MSPFQYWLEHAIYFEPVAAFMRTRWGWPAAESVHFIGLTLLFGSIATWDLRLLGIARSVPIAAFHRLVPFAVFGFVVDVITGTMFLMTEPNQYIYNPAFHFKVLFMGLAGLNVLLFYTLIFRRVRGSDDLGAAAPHAAKMCGAASLTLWLGVIVSGRLITFYRPPDCDPAQVLPFLASCIMK